MDNLAISKLQRAFYEQTFHEKISSLQSCALPQSISTLSLLTKEELKELEQLWVDFVMWKKSQSH